MGSALWNVESSVALYQGVRGVDVRLPLLGLGVYQTPRGEKTRHAVSAALRVGYRHIDTARLYGNEEDVGRAVRESGVPRAEVFVTTKLWNDDHGYDPTLRAFDESDRRLGLGYVDLYLIHWPVPGRRNDSWRAMERLLAEGRCRAIGVSNFLPRHLDDLARTSPVTPAVNQIELSPFLGQRETVCACEARGIVVEAYSPLTRGKRLRNPVVADVARLHGKTPAQILIRWSLEHGFVVLPKSAREDRIRQNAEVFDFALSSDDRARLDALDEDLHTDWDPTGVP